jgi:hypothetical protein
MRWKKFLRWRCAKVWEVGNTGLINVLQICSSNAFGLASPPVSLKPSRPQPLPGTQNESTSFSESLRGIVSKTSAPEVSEWPNA